jgi:hypothetical protein
MIERVALRLYIEDDLFAEDWLIAGHTATSGPIAHRHRAICDRAEAAGLRWRIEAWDPDTNTTMRVLEGS